MNAKIINGGTILLRRINITNLNKDIPLLENSNESFKMNDYSFDDAAPRLPLPETTFEPTNFPPPQTTFPPSPPTDDEITDPESSPTTPPPPTQSPAVASANAWIVVAIIFIALTCVLLITGIIMLCKLPPAVSSKPT